jgi:porin
MTGRAAVCSRPSLDLATVIFMSWMTGADAQLLEMPATWGGDIASRARLTGDWGGARDQMGKSGVEFDVDLLATPQSVLSGGRSTGGDTWSNLDYTLQVDTGKAGFWPGGLLRISGDTGLGANVYGDSGAIVPVNTAAMFPAVNEHTTALTNATFMQFFSERFGVAIGKINTMDTGGYEFYGDYKTQFLNAAFVFPMTLEQVPLSAFGGGIILLPKPTVSASILVLDPNGTPTSNDIGNAFSHGSIVVGSGQVTIEPYGRVGHQNFGFSWSNKERYSLEQDPSNLATLLLQQRFPRLGNPGPILEAILARYFPDLLVPAEPAARKSSTWSVSYGLDQYLWQPAGDEKHGVGVFLSLGASDGNPNPIKYAFLVGVGGKGVGARRPDDSFGVGIARTRFSSAFVPLLRTTLDLGLEHEDALELYYNCAVTGWLTATADLQVIDLGLKKTLDTSSLGLTNMNTALVAGVRLQIRF